MEVKVEKCKDGSLRIARGNYCPIEDCYEVEIIKNDTMYHDTTYRIETIDNDYVDITISELRALKEILNNKEVSELLGLEE